MNLGHFSVVTQVTLVIPFRLRVQDDKTHLATTASAIRMGRRLSELAVIAGRPPFLTLIW